MNLKFSVFILFILTCFSATAQENETGLEGHPVAVKWAPSGLAFGKLTLGGEYSLSQKKAVTLVVGIPVKSTWRQEIDGEKESLTHKTFSIMGGYRMYLGKGDGNGAYFEPYVKYLKYDAASVVNIEIDGSDRDFAITGEYSGIGVGAQLGAQFLIAKKIVIDFYFLGPEANSSKSSLLLQESGNGAAWDADDAQDAEQEIRDIVEDIPILKNKVEIGVNATEKNVSAAYKGFMPGIRFGLSFGWRF
jgi:hypothetical protein